MKQDNEDPTTMTTSSISNGDGSTYRKPFSRSSGNGFFSSIKQFFVKKNESTLREAIEDFFEDESANEEETSFSEHEKTLLSNILTLRDLCALDVMIPRADIIGIAEDASQEEILNALADKQFSRLPVYKDTLDNIVGTIHIKDILSSIAQGQNVDVKLLTRSVPIVSPSMLLSDLLLQMRMSRKHLVLVVDEFGGIDGLITINDIIESIVGEIDDEHNSDENPALIEQADGSYIADARYDLSDFEEEFGRILSQEERDESDTFGGLAFFMAGRVPARGEVLSHDSGMVLEILEADPRRVSRICIRNIPDPDTLEDLPR